MTRQREADAVYAAFGRAITLALCCVVLAVAAVVWLAVR